MIGRWLDWGSSGLRDSKERILQDNLSRTLTNPQKAISLASDNFHQYCLIRCWLKGRDRGEAIARNLMKRKWFVPIIAIIIRRRWLRCPALGCSRWSLDALEGSIYAILGGERICLYSGKDGSRAIRLLWKKITSHELLNEFEAWFSNGENY